MVGITTFYFRMKIINTFFLISFSLFLSCNREAKQREMLEIPIDIDQNISLPLSEIAEEITAIELELTDESLINTDNIQRIIITENDVIIAELNKIMVFNKDGKFVRTIGSRGQGPGEYRMINNLTFDEKNKRLFVNAFIKIICYDLNGNLIRESNIRSQDIHYNNDEILTIADYSRVTDEKGLHSRSVVYWLNDEFQIMDSCAIRNVYYEQESFFSIMNATYFSYGNSTVYFYYADLDLNTLNAIQRDTLYRLENKRFIPELKLKFKNDGIDNSGKKVIGLSEIYRSSRYIFAVYYNSRLNPIPFYYFCYDTQTGKGYNIKGYTDDIHPIKDEIILHPNSLDTEMFYYLHTNMKPDDLEEPNPTLYIGKLKK
jgi:hypothetical protein